MRIDYIINKLIKEVTLAQISLEKSNINKKISRK